ncbi:DEAD/DEAH box helicase family protein [Thermomonas sp.]|uniref:DEAD/DEAH box helicase n=1 Tax=Thermomonas sp. TaxID=1971895 RepID=UPI002B6B94F4|nr:DEAD/DEAH box helicase family protein [Thermomonas sp.]HRO62508.1 DEAD/DEAH box helicase family protein [Thermomonas sp.]
MALRDLDYQTRVLATFDDYLADLAEQKRKADKIEAANRGETDPDLIREVPDFAARAWEAMRAAGKLPASRAAIPYSPRKQVLRGEKADGGLKLGAPVPNVVFKVPTGGGKTFLAVSALSRVFGQLLGRNTGFVLWIVPNEAIYAQTWKQLNDRQHPYRQMLDRAAAGRVRVLQKDTPLDARDVEHNLCVMLLMLQSANRQTQAALKMFQDRGDVRGFFPPEGDQAAHARALEATPNLDINDLGDGGAQWPMVKDSLGNALRLIRPVVVMDEGHHATSDLAYETLYGFNPCFVLELTATPKDVAARGGRIPRPARHANVLVDVRGFELDREGMIKMPLNLDPHQGTDWRATLAAAKMRLDTLQADAQQLYADQGRYIRPIMLVQVERTGADQRDGNFIHALDARDWLLQAGLDETEIAIKTADTNDLAEPENQDLLSPTSRVRAIITKQALQEGWDCPFAYVLCALAASHNPAALTQLIGRILRQPQADKTKVPALDEAYVITHHAETTTVVEAIKKGLEEDGLGDLVKEIKVDVTGGGKGRGPRAVKRRPVFAKTTIFLPKVLRVTDEGVRDLDYEQDVLFELDWSHVDLGPLLHGNRAIPATGHAADSQMRRIGLTSEPENWMSDTAVGSVAESLQFDPVHAVRMVADIVPNPWVARDIVEELLDGLRANGFDDVKLGSIAGLVVTELRRHLDERRDAMAESRFRNEVAAGRIQFRLRTDTHNWKMPDTTITYEPDGAPQLVGRNGGPLERSLFAPIYHGDFSDGAERDVAVYLDEQQALRWWHRNVARQSYSVQGWRRDKIYPDLVFAVQRNGKGDRVVALEMKGEHLAGNDKTEYVQKLLRLLGDNYAFERVGGLELVACDGTEMTADLVLMEDWKTRIPNEFLT